MTLQKKDSIVLIIHVKALYRELRELENREQIEEGEYEEYFIGGSDVPICGRYE